MHTPGPWIICDKQEEPRTVKIGTGENGWLGVAQSFGDTQEEATANAKLIAAAPDLLEACKGLVEYLESVGIPENEAGYDVLIAAQDAIIKCKLPIRS